jgi:hypothetical protein
MGKSLGSGSPCISSTIRGFFRDVYTLLHNHTLDQFSLFLLITLHLTSFTLTVRSRSECGTQWISRALDLRIFAVLGRRPDTGRYVVGVCFEFPVIRDGREGFFLRDSSSIDCAGVWIYFQRHSRRGERIPGTNGCESSVKFRDRNYDRGDGCRTCGVSFLADCGTLNHVSRRQKKEQTGVTYPSALVVPKDWA